MQFVFILLSSLELIIVLIETFSATTGFNQVVETLAFFSSCIILVNSVSMKTERT